MNNFFLKLWVSGQNATNRAADRLRAQEGAETVQVVMIMGIMAILIAVIFFGPFGLKQKITDLGTNVGNKIQCVIDNSSSCS